jgi:hypothetical protein
MNLSKLILLSMLLGTYALAITSGIFSQQPSCSCSSRAVSTCITCNAKATSATAVSIFSYNTSGAAADCAAELLCFGAN